MNIKQRIVYFPFSHTYISTFVRRLIQNSWYISLAYLSCKREQTYQLFGTQIWIVILQNMYETRLPLITDECYILTRFLISFHSYKNMRICIYFVVCNIYIICTFISSLLYLVVIKGTYDRFHTTTTYLKRVCFSDLLWEGVKNLNFLGDMHRLYRLGIRPFS